MGIEQVIPGDVWIEQVIPGDVWGQSRLYQVTCGDRAGYTR